MVAAGFVGAQVAGGAVEVIPSVALEVAKVAKVVDGAGADDVQARIKVGGKPHQIVFVAAIAMKQQQERGGLICVLLGRSFDGTDRG